MSILKVNRLVMLKDSGTISNVVFDEPFHSGLNIIRSKGNSSGKTTIVDFIYYALGGEHTNWKEIALSCSRVILEIIVNGRVLTLRRNVSIEEKQPLDIYFGDYNNAIKDSIGWTTHSYSRQTRTLSFSEVLFKALGIPEAPSSLNAKMTMFQLLRLLYADQFSEVNHIYRKDDWSSKDGQQAIGELLCGVGDFELFAKKTELKLIDNKVSDYKAAYRSLNKILSSFSESNKIGNIDVIIKVAKQKLKDSEIALEEVQTGYDNTQNEEIKKTRKKLKSEVDKKQRLVFKLEEDQKINSYENTERSNFIEHLEDLLSDFDDANEVFSALGHIQYSHCLPVLKIYLHNLQAVAVFVAILSRMKSKTLLPSLLGSI